MVRSLYKGYFVDNKLLQSLIDAKKKKNYRIKFHTRSRASTITFDFINFTIFVHSGKRYYPLRINESMVGYKLGEFVFTKKRMIFRSKKKKIIFYLLY